MTDNTTWSIAISFGTDERHRNLRHLNREALIEFCLGGGLPKWTVVSRMRSLHCRGHADGLPEFDFAVFSYYDNTLFIEFLDKGGREREILKMYNKGDYYDSLLGIKHDG